MDASKYGVSFISRRQHLILVIFRPLRKKYASLYFDGLNSIFGILTFDKSYSFLLNAIGLIFPLLYIYVKLKLT